MQAAQKPKRVIKQTPGQSARPKPLLREAPRPQPTQLVWLCALPLARPPRWTLLGTQKEHRGRSRGSRIRPADDVELEDRLTSHQLRERFGSAVAAVAARAAPADVAGRLAQIASLHDAGVLTDAEYDAKRAELVAQL
jgi:hypothetical protein